MNYELIKKLKDPEYRKAFVASQINIGIPFQIRALLKSRPGWTQATLAEKADMLQPRISSLLTPGKTRPNIETLRRIAEAFDCGLVVRFAPFSELATWSDEFDPESFGVPSFDDELKSGLEKVAAVTGQAIGGNFGTTSHISGSISNRPLGQAVKVEAIIGGAILKAVSSGNAGFITPGTIPRMAPIGSTQGALKPMRFSRFDVTDNLPYSVPQELVNG